MEGLREDSIGKDSHDRSYNDRPLSPLVYTNETILPTEGKNLVLRTNILVGNENLLSRQQSSQNEMIASQESLGFLCPMRTTSFISAHDEHPQESQETQERLLERLSVPASSKQKRKMSPQSPFTTIPIWTPETSLGSFTLPRIDEKSSNERESCDLVEFIRFLCSDVSAYSLQQSNPYAASQGTVFGIVLFDPRATRLGKEMHRLATTLSRFVHSGTSRVPSMGSIFFLGSSMLEHDLRPDDLRFCLRDTWTGIGRDHSYGCLSWNLSKRCVGMSIGQDELHSESTRCGYVMTSEPARSVPRTPWIDMTFDDTAIAVLGEYTSIEPLAHVLYK